MKRIGVIDCGSNSFTLVIAGVAAGSWRRAFANSLPVGLGAGGFRNAMIHPDRFARGIDALAVFQETMRNYGVEAVYATGTSALRDAKNAGAFIEEVRRTLGIQIEVISGSQEAFAIWHGVKLTAPLKSGEIGLSMDIGGGSVEFVIWKQEDSGPELKWLKSVDAGVVRLKDLAKPQDPLQHAGADRLRPFLIETLQPVLEAIETWKPGALVGSSGSFDALAALLRKGQSAPHPDQGHAPSESLNRFELGQLHEQLLSAPLEERLIWKGMPSSRAPYLPLASVLVQLVLESMDEHATDEATVVRSPYALREGLVELASASDLAPSLDSVWPNLQS